MTEENNKNPKKKKVSPENSKGQSKNLNGQSLPPHKNSQGQPIKRKKKRRKKKKSLLRKILLLFKKLIPFIIIIGIGIFCYPLFMNKTLFDKWQSTESGQIIRFYEDGRVKIKGSDSDASFEIKEENHMLYTIEGMAFNMYYRFDDDNLYWGTDINNLEVFERK